MALQLNEQRTHYKDFYGRNIEQMPKLLAEGRIPMSFADFMRKRLEVRNSSDSSLKGAWIDNYFDSGDAMALDSSGKLKVDLDSKQLKAINPESKLSNGYLVLNDELYASIKAKELNPNAKGMIFGKDLTKRQVINHPVWNALSREDSKLLKDYSDIVFKDTKKRWKYDKNMGVYLPSKQETPIVGPWCIYWFVNWSYADGDIHLDNDDGRFVGVRESAEGASPQKSYSKKQIREAFRTLQNKYSQKQILEATETVQLKGLEQLFFKNLKKIF